MKKLTALLLLPLVCSLALAHEFWLQPSSYFTQANSLIRLQLRVGEHFTGDPWEPGASRVTRFQSFLGKKKTDWLPMLESKGLNNLELRFPQEGTHLLALATDSKFISLEAQAFNDYLVEDGLEHALELRKKLGEADGKSREFYRREAATLIQSGERTTEVPFKKTGFDLQILPEKNPCTMRAGETLRCQIKFKGKPLVNALVRRMNKMGEREATLVTQRTDAKGWVEFSLPSGDIMLSVVWMHRVKGSKEADWQSIWGNLTFGVR